MAVTARPEISKILLDLGIEPVDVYAVDNAEQTYISALKEGINTIEVASKDKKGDERSRILRDELKRIREKKRKINVDKLFARKQVIPTNRIRPQALLPGSADEEKKGGMGEKINSILDSIIGILRIGNLQEKKEADIDKKEREAKRRKVRENLLESTKGIAKVGKNLAKKIVSPFSNILNAIGRFFKFILAGYLFNVLFNWFTDKENQHKIDTLGRFFNDWWPALTAGALLFLTPLGTMLGALIGFLAWALPALVGLIARNPWLAGVALFTAPAWLTKVFPNLGKTPTEINIEKSISEKGVEATRQLLSEEYTNKLIKFQQSNNPFEKAKLNDELLELQNQINKLGGRRVNNQRQDDSDETEGITTMAKGGPIIGKPHSQGGVDINVEGGEFVMSKKTVQKYGVNVLNAMNSAGGGTNTPTMTLGRKSNGGGTNTPTMTLGRKSKFEGGGLVQNFAGDNLIKNFISGSGIKPKFEGGGLVGDLQSMVQLHKTLLTSVDKVDKGKFTSSKTRGLVVGLDIPVNQQNTKTIVMPEKRIAKENQNPTKIGSKTIPDILIVNSSHYREMTTRSLGIHDLVGV